MILIAERVGTTGTITINGDRRVVAFPFEGDQWQWLDDKGGFVTRNGVSRSLTPEEIAPLVDAWAASVRWSIDVAIHEMQQDRDGWRRRMEEQAMSLLRKREAIDEVGRRQDEAREAQALRDEERARGKAEARAAVARRPSHAGERRRR